MAARRSGGGRYRVRTATPYGRGERFPVRFLFVNKRPVKVVYGDSRRTKDTLAIQSFAGRFNWEKNGVFRAGADGCEKIQQHKNINTSAGDGGVSDTLRDTSGGRGVARGGRGAVRRAGLFVHTFRYAPLAPLGRRDRHVHSVFSFGVYPPRALDSRSGFASRRLPREFESGFSRVVRLLFCYFNTVPAYRATFEMVKKISEESVDSGECFSISFAVLVDSASPGAGRRGFVGRPPRVLISSDSLDRLFRAYCAVLPAFVAIRLAGAPVTKDEFIHSELVQCGPV
ncbi:hypothetical protein EVAR_8905_1 [Eumeta japonica]|uniref:Uncharacterized protein n=1 Tax=Eumeta variegata TaxID=151549 RepID=A0A4C1U094_EUMVA|nr:hypothetical protein EVAR_8905_1 [Eumeta japonica]